MKHQIGIACVLLLLNGAAKLTCQDSAPIAAQDKARIEAAIKAQDPANASSHGSEPTLKIDPVTALRNFEPGADEEYRLGKGDEITVSFAGRPEMLAKLVVGPDGRITLPLAGDVMMADRTRPEAAKAIEDALANYYTNVSVQVTVTKYTAPARSPSMAHPLCLRLWREAAWKPARTSLEARSKSTRFLSVAPFIVAPTRCSG